MNDEQKKKLHMIKDDLQIIVEDIDEILKGETDPTPAPPSKHPVLAPAKIGMLICEQFNHITHDRIGLTSEDQTNAMVRVGGDRIANLTMGHYLEDHLDKTKPTRVNFDKLMSWIQRYVPPSTGYVCVDDESDLATRLHAPGWTYNDLQIHHRVLSVIRNTRPGVQIGMYGEPWLPMSHSGDWWVNMRHEEQEYYRQNARALHDLYSYLDYSMPVLYYPLNNELHAQHCREYVKFCKELMPDKPCYPWVWHRVFTTKHYEENGLVPAGRENTLYSTSEWENMVIGPIMDAGADGIAWWGADYRDFGTAAEDTITTLWNKAQNVLPHKRNPVGSAVSDRA